jgi:hypothetical protein
MMDTDNEPLLDRHLKYLKLPFMREQHHPIGQTGRQRRLVS